MESLGRPGFPPAEQPVWSETTIHAILDDEQSLWFATGNGIARCDCTMTADCTHWIEFWPRRRPAQPRNGNQQPPLGVAIARWATVVRHA